MGASTRRGGGARWCKEALRLTDTQGQRGQAPCLPPPHMHCSWQQASGVTPSGPPFTGLPHSLLTCEVLHLDKLLHASSRNTPTPYLCTKSDSELDSWDCAGGGRSGCFSFRAVEVSRGVWRRLLEGRLELPRSKDSGKRGQASRFPPLPAAAWFLPPLSSKTEQLSGRTPACLTSPSHLLFAAQSQLPLAPALLTIQAWPLGN